MVDVGQNGVLGILGEGPADKSVVSLYDTQKMKILHEHKINWKPNWIKMIPNSSELALLGNDHENAKLYNLTDGTVKREMANKIHKLSFHPLNDHYASFQLNSKSWEFYSLDNS